MFYKNFLAARTVGCALLGLGFAATARPQSPTSAQTPASPFLRSTRHEQVEFSRAPKRTLHTWYVESRGVGLVEACVWYIADGKAVLRDQCVFWWDNKKQAGTWRLLLLEQAASQPAVLPSYELNGVFDTPNDSPDTKATGMANADTRKSVHITSAFNAVAHINANNPPGIPPNRAALFYAAQSLKKPDDRSAIVQMRSDEPFPVDALTRQSRAPGKAFLVLALTWVPPKSTAPKGSATRPAR